MALSTHEPRSLRPAAASEAPQASPWTTRLTEGFHALTVRNYRLYWSGQLISQTGSWMQRTAQDWLVLQLTHSPFALGVVTALQFLPIMLLSLIGGVISDRFSKHRLVTVTQAAALVQTIIFAALVATGGIQLWHVYILAAIQGIINAIDTPARQSFAAELVGKDHLVNAVALNSMQFNGARIIGPALAGLIIAWIGIAPTLFVNALSFVAVLASLALMNKAEFFVVPPKNTGRAGRQLLDGLAYVWHNPTILLVMIIVGVIGTFGYNFGVVIPLLAGFVLNTGAAGYGALSASLGVGSVIGAIATAYTKKITLRRLMIASAFFSVLLGVVALSTSFLFSSALLVALGFAGILFSTSANTLLQLTVPDELRGRVMSLYFLLFAGSTPIGGFLIGSLSNVPSIGVSGTILICAVLCLVGVGGAAVYRSRLPQEASS